MHVQSVTWFGRAMDYSDRRYGPAISKPSELRDAWGFLIVSVLFVKPGMIGFLKSVWAELDFL